MAQPAPEVPCRCCAAPCEDGLCHIHHAIQDHAEAITAARFTRRRRRAGRVRIRPSVAFT